MVFDSRGDNMLAFLSVFETVALYNSVIAFGSPRSEGNLLTRGF